MLRVLFALRASRGASRVGWGLAVLCLWGMNGSIALGQSSQRSIADRRLEWPEWAQWRRLVLLEDYNTRVVIFSVAILGLASGVVGGFTLLRRRALMGDALAHASLPGIALAYIVATLLGLDAKWLPYLLAGATLSGLMGVGGIVFIRRFTRLKEDTALGIVLSVFFGAGMALLGVIQNMSTGHAAGLEGFIYGKTASIAAQDARLIAWSAALVIAGCVLLFKELKLLCFDTDFAGARGFPVWLLDLILMTLVVLTTMVGLQAVGLILVVALLVIPAATARFWTEKMWCMTLISGAIGMVGGILGAASSALLPRLPSGAMIVLVCAVLFLLSMLFGTHRGVLQRWTRRRRLNRRVAREHLLRGLYELSEKADRMRKPAPERASDEADFERPEGAAGPSGKLNRRSGGHKRPQVSFASLLEIRSWSGPALRRVIRRMEKDGMVRRRGDEIVLTQAGYIEAARLTRQHRLWELYLLEHADVAPARVDRDADAIEHVLEPEIVDELERLLDQQPMAVAVPSNPHDGEGA